MHIHFKKWLQDLFGSIAFTADSLLHLVEGEFGGMQESLVHGPVVVTIKLFNFFLGNWLYVLVQLVPANCVN